MREKSHGIVLKLKWGDLDLFLHYDVRDQVFPTHVRMTLAYLPHLLTLIREIYI